MTYPRILPLLLLAACQTSQTQADSASLAAGSNTGSNTASHIQQGDTQPGSAYLQVLDLSAAEDAQDSDTLASLQLRTVIHVQPRALNLPYDLYLTISILPEGLSTGGIKLWGSGGESNVARMTDNTVKIRVGSLQPSTLPVELALRVPFHSEGSLPARLRLITKVERIDTASGRLVQPTITLADQLESIREGYGLERFDAEDIHALWESVHEGQYAMFSGVLESRAPDFAKTERLWIDLACAQDSFTTRWLKLPTMQRPDLPSDRSLLMDDDGNRTRIEVGATRGLDPDLELAAHLDLEGDRAIHAQQIQSLPNGKIRLSFPSLQSLGLDPADVTGLTLYELDPSDDSEPRKLQIARFDKLHSKKSGKLN